MIDEPRYPVTVDGEEYVLVPQPVRMSLSDSPAALWGFEVNVLRGEELLGIKTCFVGRVRVHTINPAVVDGPMEALVPVLHSVAVAKVTERLAEGELGDEILFS